MPWRRTKRPARLTLPRARVAALSDRATRAPLPLIPDHPTAELLITFDMSGAIEAAAWVSGDVEIVPEQSDLNRILPVLRGKKGSTLTLGELSRLYPQWFDTGDPSTPIVGWSFGGEFVSLDE